MKIPYYSILTLGYLFILIAVLRDRRLNPTTEDYMHNVNPKGVIVSWLTFIYSILLIVLTIVEV